MMFPGRSHVDLRSLNNNSTELRQKNIFYVPEKVVKGTLAFSRDLAFECIQIEREQEKRREGNKRG